MTGSNLADMHPSATPGKNFYDQVDDGSQSGSEAASNATSPGAGKVGSAPGKKKSGRRPRRKKKSHAPASQSEQGQGRQEQQQQQQQKREQQQSSSSPKQQDANSSAAHAQSKATPKPGPSATAEINKSLSVAMMASPIFQLPFPLMSVLGVTLLAGQGKPSSEKKGDGSANMIG
ncbi:uncharacterized protein PgNI_11999 [Pyricularia grisea]|uniref:Uncharacterized protein n=1 Tax=Pyricularia grisea TaxID=148305 RepID=A0A6P8AQG1_PYRGI|nr:uncharacterized protein PgNI_11999 [Pyricularia grisea]TLD04274.1 hypothetical protein PgNI_11999 [Pyricularia grisea]